MLIFRAGLSYVTALLFGLLVGTVALGGFALPVLVALVSDPSFIGLDIFLTGIGIGVGVTLFIIPSTASMIEQRAEIFRNTR